MDTANWIALAAVLITTFGAIVGAAYIIVKLMIKCSQQENEIARMQDKIDQLKEHIRGTN